MARPDEQLLDVIQQLRDNNDSLMNMLSIIVHRLGGDPIIITEKDVREMPRTGMLVIHTDQATGSIMISFNTGDETSDSERGT
jgi:hypothetical protein